MTTWETGVTAMGPVLNVTPARMLRLAKRYGIKTGQRGGQRFARYQSGACLLQFSLEGERHYLHLGTAGERVLLSHEWAERDETRRIKSRYEVIPVPHELLRELGFVEGGAGNGAQI